MPATTLDDRCPRCGGGFHCGMNDAAPCACSGPTLDAALLQQLRQRYSGCLCLGCLRELAAPAAITPTPISAHPAPAAHRR